MPLSLSSDAHYATVRADLESDAQDLEAVSWSLAAEQQHVKKHSKEMVQRQDVIYGKCDFTFTGPVNKELDWIVLINSPLVPHTTIGVNLKKYTDSNFSCKYTPLI